MKNIIRIIIKEREHTSNGGIKCTIETLSEAEHVEVVVEEWEHACEPIVIECGYSLIYTLCAVCVLFQICEIILVI